MFRVLVLSGIASIIFGVPVPAVPGAGALVIALWFGDIRHHSGVFGIRPEKLGPDFPGGRPYSRPGALTLALRGTDRFSQPNITVISDAAGIWKAEQPQIQIAKRKQDPAAGNVSRGAPGAKR
jgi:hypothetical protein